MDTHNTGTSHMQICTQYLENAWLMHPGSHVAPVDGPIAMGISEASF